MELVRPRSSNSIDQLIAKSAETEPTYSEVGATLNGEQPPGYRHDEYEAKLGEGREAFLRASTGLQTWRSHKGLGIDVLPHGTPIELGATVVVTLGFPWLSLAAPCRIVGVLDEPDRWGFAYGTLPGHPEQGEESFVASINGNDEGAFRITAFSRPGEWLTRLAGPIGRVVQRAGTNGYVKALEGYLEQAN